jgi:hypothetical protein
MATPLLSLALNVNAFERAANEAQCVSSLVRLGSKEKDLAKRHKLAQKALEEAHASLLRCLGACVKEASGV